jgi:hypothetical protein
MAKVNDLDKFNLELIKPAVSKDNDRNFGR